MKQEGPEHHRFYLPPDAIGEQDIVTFPESESTHMLSSLRMSRGDTVIATDGRGKICKVRLEHVRARQSRGRIVGVTRAEQAKPTIRLFQGVVKSSRMDLVIEKCTELGIAGFTPVITKRSVRRLSNQKLERLRRIAIEAMKQSLGSYLPDVSAPVSFEDAIRRLHDFDLVLVAYEHEQRRTLEDIAAKSVRGRIALWVGPEGSFTQSEIAALAETGALPFTLGRLRLRTETAAIASVAILNHLLQHHGWVKARPA